MLGVGVYLDVVFFVSKVVVDCYLLELGILVLVLCLFLLLGLGGVSSVWLECLLLLLLIFLLDNCVCL